MRKLKFCVLSTKSRCIQTPEQFKRLDSEKHNISFLSILGFSPFTMITIQFSTTTERFKYDAYSSCCLYNSFPFE